MNKLIVAEGLSVWSGGANPREETLTRINHSRPVLRYLDNFRREAGRIGAADWRSSAMKPQSTSGTDELMIQFDLLDEEQRGIFNICLERYLAYIDAQGAYIASIGGKRRSKGVKAKFGTAKAEFVTAAAVLLLLELEAQGRGDLGALDWYGRFHKSMPDQDRRSWDDFNTLLFEDAMDELGVPSVEALSLE